MSLFAFAPSRGPRWPLGLQAAIGIAAPIAVMTLVGHAPLGYVAASGAFTVLYAGSAPVIDRARVLPIVAVALLLSASLGVLVAGNTLVVSVGVVVVATVSAALAFGFRLGPPGPLFFVLVYGLSAHVVASGAIAPLVYLAALAGGCLFSYLVALAPLALPRVRRIGARPLRDLLPGPAWNADSRMLLLRVLIVSIVGVLLGLVVDPDRTYWIVGSAVAVIGVAAARRAAFQRGLHRMLGTVVGAGLYILLALLHPAGIWLALLLGLLQFSIELVVVRHYALALVFITPLVLLLTGAATGSIGRSMWRASGSSTRSSARCSGPPPACCIRGWRLRIREGALSHRTLTSTREHHRGVPGCIGGGIRREETRMELTLVTSAFCGACARTRAVLADAARFLPDATITEIDVARDPDAAEALDIRFTPTVIIRGADGHTVFRAEGVPTVPQVLTAAVRALPD